MKRTWYWIFLGLGLMLILLWIFSNRLGINDRADTKLGLQLLELRGVAKLVIWEQDFQLNHMEKIERDYAGLFKTSEKINSTIEGKMGFHIDLADSVNTKFIIANDTIIINAPLQNTYIELDLATLQQIKEKSLDPTLEIKEHEVIKKLRKRALEEFVPSLRDRLSEKDLQYQEHKLSTLLSRPVKIYITHYPTIDEMKWMDMQKS